MKGRYKLSLRAAINDKCKECLFDEQERGTWREQIFMCADVRCPLYRVRPRPAITADCRVLEWMRAEPRHPWWETAEARDWTRSIAVRVE